MGISIYVDGSGGTMGAGDGRRRNSGYGYFVKETGESFYEEMQGITSNQAEYMAIISALTKFGGAASGDGGSGGGNYKDGNNNNNNNADGKDDITIFSDSLNTVKQLNHEYAINDGKLRELARQAWGLMGPLGGRLSIVWIRREHNMAGKMLGS